MLASWKGANGGMTFGALRRVRLFRRFWRNVYLHYVLDLWFHKKWRARTAEGNTIIVRYADDFVVGFQYQRDAERFLHDLKERMGLVFTGATP